MRKFKITSQVEKDLKHIAGTIPLLYDQTTYNKKILGSDLKLTGHDKDENGKELEDDRIYDLPTPSMIPVNHYRRLKKAFLSGGEPEVIK